MHTKGPWKVNTANGRLPVVRKVVMPYGEAATYTATIQTSDGEYVCKLDFGYGKKQDEANANLIAAAPEMLAALKELEIYAGCFCDYHMSQFSDYPEKEHSDFCVRVREVVKRAEGG